LEALDDLTATPAEFFEQVFSIIKKFSESSHSKRVFIVHGHDPHSRDQLAEILRKLQFDPIILADEPSRSLTIIEKLERNTTNIGFSFIIYTPDDVGRSKAGLDMARARQNVIFEHGLLIGLLGRERTCALLLGEVEEPSDIRGMLYERVTDIRSDSLKVARVLKDAGYSVDASTLI
jgi:predicted nucleotide-binding protein